MMYRPYKFLSGLGGRTTSARTIANLSEVSTAPMSGRNFTIITDTSLDKPIY